MKDNAKLTHKCRLIKVYSATMTTPKPFPFLRLPTELRLIVYEALPIQTQHYHVREKYTRDRPKASCSNLGLILVLNDLAGISILATCKTIHAEASKTLGRKLDALRMEPLRIITNTEFLNRRYLVAILEGVQGSPRFKGWHNVKDLYVKDKQLARFIEGAKHCKHNQKSEVPEVHIALRVPSDASKLLGEFYGLRNKVLRCIRFNSFFPPRGNPAIDIRLRYALPETSEDEMPSQDHLGRYWECLRTSVSTPDSPYSFLWRKEWQESWIEGEAVPWVED